MRNLALLLATLAVAGCGREDAKGGVTADEERRLEEAARMLDENTIDVSPDSLVANEADLDDGGNGLAAANRAAAE